MDKAERVKCAGYDVVVGLGVLDELGADLEAHVAASKYVVVMDTNVERVVGARLEAGLACCKDKVVRFVLAPGEGSKSRQCKASLEDWMVEQGCDRQACLVAVGGGVVGDLTGFVAATFMRGIRFVQVPTTLLAMVDSSIGGKTGIDTPAGKNLIGAFHRPTCVYTDPSLLASLPLREVCNGMGEVIKHAAIRNADYFTLLEQSVEKVLAKDVECLLPIVLESVRIKVDVVVRDEKEGGLREILNFGHSVGHGIEALLTPSWLHGECVAVGMVREIEIARAVGAVSPDALSRTIACLSAYKLPVAAPQHVSAVDVLAKMAVDKKNKGGKKRIVLLKEIGDAGNNAHAVADHVIHRVLSRSVTVSPIQPPQGEVRVPGSKSISNRVLLMAALGQGECALRGLLHSDDTKVMLHALTQLGCPPVRFEDGGNTVVVQGCNGRIRTASAPLYLANAGTASRFLTTACTLAAAGDGSNGTTVVAGNKRMHERPIADLVDALRGAGCSIEYQGAQGCPPLAVGGGGFPGGNISLKASTSSQYVSSILISAPYAASPVRLALQGEVVSKPYIDMTVRLMRLFGVDVREEEGGEGGPGVVYCVPNDQGYKNPSVFDVESDASSASYPLALAAVHPGSKVTALSIGTGSLQGDSRFCQVLEKMGCEVSQGESSTTVCGTDKLQGVEIDMGDITDTFMTAAVVMALCDKGVVSRITGIANQRVKECNRIEAMVTELRKCGVTCRELDTGIEIEGAGREPPEQLAASPALIHCYNDHRIAMSFAVLGSVWPGIVITDKDCVEKTFPDFWDHLCKLAASDQAVLPYDDDGPQGEHNAPRPSHSVVLVGMRGSGKTTLGKVVAKELGLRFVDLDDLTTAECERLMAQDAQGEGEGEGEGTGIRGFVAKHGWDRFRDVETATLGAALAEIRSTGAATVVACGGGVVEREANRNTLQGCGHTVVWIDRPIVEVIALLEGEGSGGPGGQGSALRPAYGESVEEVFARRRPWYDLVSSHVFRHVRRDGDVGGGAVEDVCWDFVRFVRAVTGHGLPPLPPRDEPSYFVSLTLPTYRPTKDLLETLARVAKGAHAVELRADLVQADMGLTEAVAFREASALRSAMSSFMRRALPVIFTVRSKDQGGRFHGDEQAYFALLRAGARAGCEVVDVEACWSEAGRKQFALWLKARGPGQRTIGSMHLRSPCTGHDHLAALCHACRLGGLADIVKVVFTARNATDCAVQHAARVALEAGGAADYPLLVMSMGDAGKLSRVLNFFLLPVTHAALPGAAAPGQLTVEEVEQARALLGIAP